MSAISFQTFCRISSLSNMELSQLAIFIEAARCKSYSEAARRLYLSHSTVSRAVSALEAELGVALVMRSNHVIGLTEAGARLYDGGQVLLADADALAARVRDAQTEKR